MTRITNLLGDYLYIKYLKQISNFIYTFISTEISPKLSGKSWLYLASMFSILLLSSCTYNGLSGSSASISGNCPEEIDELWIQDEQSDISQGTNHIGKNCGCRVLGNLDGEPRRCFFYFRDGIVISGYIIQPATANAANCKAPINLNAAQVTEFKSDLNNLANTKSPGDALFDLAGSVHFTYAVGSCNIQANDQIVAGTDNNNRPIINGNYFDIRYPGGRESPLFRDIICSSYALRGNTLFLAGDPSGGGIPQNPDTCNRDRLTNLIEYAKQ